MTIHFENTDGDWLNTCGVYFLQETMQQPEVMNQTYIWQCGLTQKYNAEGNKNSMRFTAHCYLFMQVQQKQNMSYLSKIHTS